MAATGFGARAVLELAGVSYRQLDIGQGTKVFALTDDPSKLVEAKRMTREAIELWLSVDAGRTRGSLPTTRTARAGGSGP
jgi:hypothetical protein